MFIILEQWMVFKIGLRGWMFSAFWVILVCFLLILCLLGVGDL